MKERINATVAIVDIRNFTPVFENFEKQKDDSFIKYMEEYYLTGHRLANLAAFDKKVFFKTSGDGYIVIFYGKNHERAGYLFGLLLYKTLIQKCKDFNNTHKTKVLFGMGIETGKVIQVLSDGLENFLGSVINVAARIENSTKLFDNTHLIIGHELYIKLIEILYGKAQKEKVVNRSDSYEDIDYKRVIQLHNELNNLSQKLMLFYLFKHHLKGVEEPTPLYRLSPCLTDFDLSKNFSNVIELLCNNSDKFKKIQKEIQN